VRRCRAGTLESRRCGVGR